ncbi:MAG: transporter substrate-binding domain-containing protein [Rhodocyclales bacterium]|nr:transporter substrate-binding domain-containing protein [Rhodocyclales bacterium]
MNNNRRAFALALGGLWAGLLLPAHAAAEPELQQAGTLRIAVYADFAPYSARGKGVDIALGQALAERLGLRAEIVEFPADENMTDDLRNMVWRGHYLGTRPADVMLHVPVDAYFAAQNDKVTIFGPYHLETMAIARDPARVPPLTGTPDQAFEVFTREKIGVELDTHASDYLLHVRNGGIRDNVVHYRSIAEAVTGLRNGDISAIMAPHGQIEGTLGTDARYQTNALALPGMRATHWPLGMAIKANHGELQTALSNALIELQRSGELTRIFTTHGLTHRVP